MSQHHATRREALRAGLTGLAALSLAGRVSAQAPPEDRTYGPFRMGIQSYSLRGYKTLDEALEKTKALGLRYWESYRAHIPMTQDAKEQAELRKKLSDAGVTLLGYGVLQFTKNDDENKRIFDFGRAMGITYFSADPNPDSFDSLDKLVDSHGIAIGIHNHGPGHRYATIESIQKAIKDRHPKIGVCNDTGHFLRSGIDPVKAVEVFGARTFGVHLKDVKDTKTFTVLGEGDLRTADLMKALAKIGYGYCMALEYEEHPENPIDEIRACLDAAKKSASTLKSA